MNKKDRSSEQKGLALVDGSNRSEAIVSAFALLILLAVPLLETFRGLDLTDMGFVLTNQRLVFSHPESVSYWFHLWLTNVLGGVVDLLFGSYGVLSHKIAGSLIYVGTMAAAFSLYKGFAKRSLILIALAVSCAFNFIFKINIVHYNNLSVLLYVVSAVVFASATLNRNRWGFFFSGFILGINAFARIPNAVGLAIVFVPLLIDILNRRSETRLRLGLRDYASFAAGAAAAVLAALLTMFALGHLQIFIDSIGKLFSQSLFEKGGHRIDRSSYHILAVIGWPVLDTAFALLYGSALAILLGAISAGVSALGKRRGLAALALLAVTALFFIALTPLFASMWKYTQDGLQILYHAVAGLCYWAIVWIVLDARFDRAQKLTAVLSAFLSLALNVGSNTKIEVSSYVFPVMFPALLTAAKAAGALIEIRGYRPLAAHALVIVAAFAGISGFWLEGSVYRDTSAMRFTAINRQISGIYTSERRARALDQLLAALPLYAKAGDELFACDGNNLVNFAMRTRPYLGTAWPGMYTSEYLDIRLRAEETKMPLPVVVRSIQFDTQTKDPIGPFLERNSYREAWRNSDFVIYIQRIVGTP